MPLTKGKMRKDHERKIMKNLVALKQDMDAKDLVDWFIQEEIFDFADNDIINGYNPNTASNRNNAFFKLLFNSGPQAYEVFLKALERNGQTHLAERIENTELAGGDDIVGEEASWISTIPQSTRTRRLNERDISKLAQYLGAEWEIVMFDLGLTKPDVDHAKMEHPHSPTMQIYSCLNKWRVRKVTEATLEKLVQTLCDCQCTTIDWAGLKRQAQQM